MMDILRLLVCLLVFSSPVIWLIKKLKNIYGGKHPKPQNDSAKAVENPELMAILKACKDNPTNENLECFSSLLNNATFLIATDWSDVTEKDHQDNKFTIQAGSKIKVFTITDDNNDTYLPVFTDWDCIRKYIADEVHGWVMSAKEAFEFAVSETNNYKGIIINPTVSDICYKNEQLKKKLADISFSECASELTECIKEEYCSENGQVNVEETILATGNLTGLFLFRSFDFTYADSIEPGSVLLSEEANKLGPIVFSRICAKLTTYGFDAEKMKPENRDYHTPLTYLDRIDGLQQKAEALFEKYEYTPLQAIEVCESVTAFFLYSLCRQIPVNEALGFILFGIIEGSKTVPFHKDKKNC